MQVSSQLKLLFFCLIFELVTGTRVIAQERAGQKLHQHQWEYIMYPHINLPRPHPTYASFLLAYRKEEPGLKFQITLGTDESNLPKKSEMTVCLHRSGREKITLENPGAGAIGSGLGMSYHYLYHFPWGKNLLEEAWIEVRFPEKTYWLEIPYGFTRNPADPLAPDAPQQGVPVLVPAMKELGSKDQILPWLFIQYDLGEIQNKWRLSVKQANRLHGETELILYREDQRVGKSIYVWELCSPQTTVKIVRPNGSIIGSTCMSVRRLEDGFRRSDTFKLSGDAAEGRDWGLMIITVDEKSYELTMPSSLFRYTHGLAEPNHNRRYWPQKE